MNTQNNLPCVTFIIMNNDKENFAVKPNFQFQKNYQPDWKICWKTALYKTPWNDYYLEQSWKNLLI